MVTSYRVPLSQETEQVYKVGMNKQDGGGGGGEHPNDPQTTENHCPPSFGLNPSEPGSWWPSVSGIYVQHFIKKQNKNVKSNQKSLVTNKIIRRRHAFKNQRARRAAPRGTYMTPSLVPTRRQRVPAIRRAGPGEGQPPRPPPPPTPCRAGLVQPGLNQPVLSFGCGELCIGYTSVNFSKK